MAYGFFRSKWRKHFWEIIGFYWKINNLDDENENVLLKDDIDLVYIFDLKKYVDSTQTLQNEQINYNIVRISLCFPYYISLKGSLNAFLRNAKFPKFRSLELFHSLTNSKKFIAPLQKSLAPENADSWFKLQKINYDFYIYHGRHWHNLPFFAYLSP